MSNVVHQRCRNHGLREAVARCVECRRYFCRECIVEHEDRILCAGCLSLLLEPKADRKWRVGGLAQAGQFFAGLVILWIAFYTIGRALLQVPSEFHAQSLWRASPVETLDEE